MDTSHWGRFVQHPVHWIPGHPNVVTPDMRWGWGGHIHNYIYILITNKRKKLKKRKSDKRYDRRNGPKLPALTDKVQSCARNWGQQISSTSLDPLIPL